MDLCCNLSLFSQLRTEFCIWTALSSHTYTQCVHHFVFEFVQSTLSHWLLCQWNISKTRNWNFHFDRPTFVYKYYLNTLHCAKSDTVERKKKKIEPKAIESIKKKKNIKECDLFAKPSFVGIKSNSVPDSSQNWTRNALIIISRNGQNSFRNAQILSFLKKFKSTYQKGSGIFVHKGS